MNEAEKLNLIAEVLELTPSEINADTDLVTVNTWDSMAALSLIVMLEENFQKVDVDSQMIKSFKKISDILDIMEKKI